MLRFLRLVAQFLVLVIVALASALISMRLAIHGREVSVPELRGLLPADAEQAALAKGLELAVSDHFYSATVPEGRIVSQQPEPGTHLRRGWRLQAALSLGPQRIEIPNLVGISPRAAEIEIRRRGLEAGSVAELPTDAFAAQIVLSQIVLAQSPAAGAQGVASPRVSLLYAAPSPAPAYVMPDLTGITLAQASSLIAAAGLKLASIASAPANAISPLANPTPELTTVVAQSPAPGSRVTASTDISLQVAHPQ